MGHYFGYFGGSGIYGILYGPQCSPYIKSNVHPYNALLSMILTAAHMEPSSPVQGLKPSARSPKPRHCNPLRPLLKVLFLAIPCGYIILKMEKNSKEMTGQSSSATGRFCLLIQDEALQRLADDQREAWENRSKGHAHMCICIYIIPSPV